MLEHAQFQRLVDAWRDPLCRFALGLTRNHEDALDLTQQTFALRVEKSHRLRDARKAKSWLFMVLYREFLRTRRPGHPPATCGPARFSRRWE